jgi:hypothetical protein
MGLVDCNQLLIPGSVQNPVLTKMILEDYPEFVGDEFNWQQHVDWVMKKVEWEKARGTDLAKLFPLVEEEASFMHTYLTIATAERDRLADRVDEFENMQHIWVEQEEEYEETIKELRAQLAEAERNRRGSGMSYRRRNASGIIVEVHLRNYCPRSLMNS